MESVSQRHWTRTAHHTRALRSTVRAFEAFRLAVMAGDPAAMLATWTRYRKCTVKLHRWSERLVG
jgi:hypothetical protein